MRHAMHLIWIAALASAAFGQGRPGGTAPSALPPVRNIDSALDGTISLDAVNLKLNDVIGLLRQSTQTNVVINWNALAISGVTRDTPISLRLKNLSYENVVRTLMEVIPLKAGADASARPNYTVGDNTLTITTNAELGKAPAAKLYPLSRILTYSLDGPADTEGHSQIVEKVLRTELVRSGEPMGMGDHGLVIKSGTLAANVSARGQTIIARAESLFTGPVKIGQMAPGIGYSAAAKRTDEALKGLISGAPAKASLIELAADPGKVAPNLNVAFLPGASEELAKAAPHLGYVINDGGVVLIGAAETLRQRTVLCVYDLRDLIKRLAFKSTMKPLPAAADFQTAIVKILHDNIEPASWGEIDKSAASMTPYDGLLVVFATAEVHRTIGAALQDMYK